MYYRKLLTQLQWGHEVCVRSNRRSSNQTSSETSRPSRAPKESKNPCKFQYGLVISRHSPSLSNSSEAYNSCGWNGSFEVSTRQIIIVVCFKWKNWASMPCPSVSMQPLWWLDASNLLNSDLAVLRGAGIRALEELAPRIKYVRRHYGFRISRVFRELLDEEKYAYIDDYSNQKYCKGRAVWCVSKVREFSKSVWRQ